MNEALERLTAALAGRYAIERELGAGGMATVYLAHDLKHDRDVAIKVLHPDLGAALGAERFLSEIRTTARLQHPHILPLLDSGDAEGLLYYVMPLVTGETLRTRLERERQLPVDVAVLIAREVADALGYAHGLGVIHRDIKPENILLQGGHALVADFGIALAVQSAGGARMTQTGLSLGTPQYMSPEQAMGERTIDARSDIYALGAVTYEMLVGEPPFTGPSVQAIVARIMTEEPRGLSVQRKAVPGAVEAAVLHALEKLPADRFATAAEFAESLAGRGFAVPTRGTAASKDSFTSAAVWRRRFLIAGAAALVATGAAVWGWAHPRTLDNQGVDRQYVSLGDSARLQTNQRAGPPLALSPDGSRLAFIGDTASRIWVKRRDALDPLPIAGTERASSPTFSPDGEWIAYLANGQLRKVPADGGASVTLADSAAASYGIAWLDDGTLIFPNTSVLGMRRVSASGGAVSVALADTALNGVAGLLPTPLPDSRGVIFTECASNCVTSSTDVLDLRTGHHKVLVKDGAMGWYLPTGQLLYTRRDGVALVAPFDLNTLSITGPATPVLEGVGENISLSQIAWSRSGTLVYGTGTAASNVVTLRYADASGAMTTPDPSWRGQFNSFALSPDGKRVAVGVTTGGAGLDIWVKQLPAGPFTRFTFSGHDRRPAWSPDGREIAFIRDSTSGGDVYARAASGGGGERRIAHLDRAIQEVSWSHDGRWLLVRTDNAGAGNGDILAVATHGELPPVSIAATPFTELQPVFSPDGRWAAYVSNESGINQLYVRPFPDAGAGKWQVSNTGGASPAWSPDGKALFFLDATSQLTAARIGPGSPFNVTGLKPLFDADRFNYLGYHQVFDVIPDGRFVFLGDVTTTAPRVVQVTNWFADLRAKAKP